MIQVNDIAVVRASGEKVFVKAINADGSVRVRRPIMTENGIQHQEDDFLLAELSLPIDFLETEHNEMQELNDRMSAKYAAKAGALKIKPADADIVN